jgi:protease-4
VLDGRSWSADEVRKAGLIDSVGFREDALGTLGQLCDLGRHPHVVHLSRDPLIQREWMVPAPIAVVYASGGLESGPSGNDLLLGPTLGAATAVRQIENAFHHHGVKAVVLRVESPGGESLASSLIDHTLVRMKRETGKPLIVSMGGVAASGGYEISAHGDRLFADRFTRTGSIGVLAVKPSFEGFYRKHGVREDDFQRGDSMGGLSVAKDWDARMQAAADSSVADSYRRFLGTVADGRHLPVDEIEPVARGRVWMGEDARARRLVDAIGGLDAALDEARRRAGVPAGEKIRLVEYRRPRPPFFERLVGTAVSDVFENSLRLPERGGILHWADDDLAP